MVRVKVIFKAVGGLAEAAKPVIIDNYYIFVPTHYIFPCIYLVSIVQSHKQTYTHISNTHTS